MKTSISTDTTIFDQQAAEIEKLVMVTPGKPFFSLPFVQAAWAKYLSQGTLVAISVRNDQDQLVGFVAFDQYQENGKKIWQLIGGTEESDYLDVLAQPQQNVEVFHAIVNEIKKLAVDEVRLTSLSQHSTTLTAFSTLAKESGWQVTQTQQDVCPVITLSKGWSVSSSTKRAVKEIEAEEDIAYEVVAAASDLPAAVTDFITLHQQSGTEKSAFWTPEREAYVREVAEQSLTNNCLKLYFLKVDHERAAALWIFDFDNQFLLYNSGFNAFRYGHLRVGTVLTAHTIQAAIQLGKTRYDFMRGDEPYKFTFGAVAEPVYDVVLTKSS